MTWYNVHGTFRAEDGVETYEGEEAASDDEAKFISEVGGLDYVVTHTEDEGDIDIVGEFNQTGGDIYEATDKLANNLDGSDWFILHDAADQQRYLAYWTGGRP